MSAFVGTLLTAGWERVSFLELVWLVLSCVCVVDTAWLFFEARATFGALAAFDDEDVECLLAVTDLRGAGQAMIVQICFLGLGVMGALRAPQAWTATDEEAWAGLVSVVLLLVVQLVNVVGARERRRYARKVDLALRAAPRGRPLAGGRRFYDPEQRS